MADSIASYSATQISSNYQKYKEYFTTEDTSSLDQMDFLKLMTEQMKNQDFTNPTDNTEFIAQMAQFNTLQQMQQMTFYSNASFAASLVGKIVTVSSVNEAGVTEGVTDIVDGVKMNGTEVELFVGGKLYSTSDLKEVLNESLIATKSK